MYHAARAARSPPPASPNAPLRPPCSPAHRARRHVPEFFFPLLSQRVEMRQPRLRHILGQPLLGPGDLPGELAILVKQIAEMQPPAAGRLDIHIGPNKTGVNVDLRTEQSIYGPVKSILRQVEPQRRGVKVRAQSKGVYDPAA